MFKRVIEEKFGVIIFAIAGVLIIPQLYFLSNLEEFSKDILLPLVSLVVAVCILFLGLCLPIKGKIQYILGGLGLSILICDQFLRMDIIHLDGSASRVIINPLVATVNTLIYVGLPIFFLIYSKQLKKTLIDLTYIVIILGIGVSSYSFYNSWGGSSLNEVVSPQKIGLPQPKKRPNIYFLWLDAIETDYMQKYVEERNNAPSFAGFSLFENNSSNYLYTAQSNVSFMSGTIFKGHEYSKWSQNSNQLRQDLKSLGYRITTYAKKDFTSPLDDITYQASDIFQKKTKTKHPFLKDFISYSVVRVLPGAVANQSLIVGQSIGAYASVMFNQKSEFSTVSSIADGIHPLSGVFTLEKLIEDEPLREKNNEFVIAQALIPHGPYVIDKDCGYRGRSTNALAENYYEQIECAAGLVEVFLDRLKSLNKYHSSIIVIMGDHGSGWAGLLGRDKKGEPALNPSYMPWSKSMVISRASALLMIKPHNTTTKDLFKIREKESQLVDIYPTLLSLLGANDKLGDNLDGIDLNSPDAVARDKYITYFKPSQTINPFIAEIYDLKFDGQNRDLSLKGRFMAEKDLPELKCGEVINFSSTDQASQTYLSAGLSSVERWGRWSNDESVTIKFKTPKAACKKTEIAVKLRGFVTQDYTVQESEVSYNGERLGHIKINTGQPSTKTFTFSLPHSTYRPGQVGAIKFTVKNAISPKELDISNDTRRIGLGFESMSVQ